MSVRPVLFYALSVTFSLHLLMNQSQYKDPVLLWGAVGVASFVSLCNGLVCRQIDLFRLKPIGFWVVTCLLIWIAAIFVIPAVGNHIASMLKLTAMYFIAISFWLFYLGLPKQKNFFIYTFALWCCLNFLFLPGYISDFLREGAVRPFHGIYVDRNFFSFSTLVLFAFSLQEPTKTRVRIAFSVLTAVFVFLSASLTGILAFIALMLFYYYPRFGRAKLLLIFLLGLFVVGGFCLLHPELSSKIQYVVRIIQGKSVPMGSIHTRVWLISESVTLWFSRPAFGVGLDNAREFLIPDWWNRVEIGFNTHSNIFETLVNRGLIGFVHWYGILIYIFKYSKGFENGHFIRSLIILYFFIGFGSVTGYSFTGNVLYFGVILLYFNPILESVRGEACSPLKRMKSIIGLLN